MRRTPPVVGLLPAVLAVALSGCSGVGIADIAERDTAEDAVELNEGGDCGGRDVLINRDGVGVVLSGECATVTIEANGAHVDVARSEAVVVAGQDSSVSGRETGSLTVSGRSNTTAVDVVGSAEIHGNVVTVTGNRAERVTVSGSGNTIAVEDVVSAGFEGNDNRMSAGALGEFELTGSNNSVDWTSGTTRPTVNTGSDNRVTGPGTGP